MIERRFNADKAEKSGKPALLNPIAEGDIDAKEQLAVINIIRLIEQAQLNPYKIAVRLAKATDADEAFRG